MLKRLKDESMYSRTMAWHKDTKEAGESKTTVAKSFGTHKVTLQKILKRSSPVRNLERYSQTNSPEIDVVWTNH